MERECENGKTLTKNVTRYFRFKTTVRASFLYILRGKYEPSGIILWFEQTDMSQNRNGSSLQQNMRARHLHCLHFLYWMLVIFSQVGMKADREWMLQIWCQNLSIALLWRKISFRDKSGRLSHGGVFWVENSGVHYKTPALTDRLKHWRNFPTFAIWQSYSDRLDQPAAVHKLTDRVNVSCKATLCAVGEKLKRKFAPHSLQTQKVNTLFAIVLYWQCILTGPNFQIMNERPYKLSQTV